MSIIRITEEGVEIGDIILKDTADLKAYISAHRPQTLDISVGITQPFNLVSYLTAVQSVNTHSLGVYIKALNVYASFNALLNSHTPTEFISELGVVTPFSLTVDLIIPLSFYLERMNVYLYPNPPTYLIAELGLTYPSYMLAHIASHVSKPLDVVLKLNYPYSVDIDLMPIPYFRLNVSITIYSICDFPPVYVESHLPRDLNLIMSTTSPVSLYSYITPMHVANFRAWFFTVEVGQADLIIYLICNKTDILPLVVDMYVWSNRPLTVVLGARMPYTLDVPIWVWTPSNINVLVGITFPPSMSVYFNPQAEPGADLIIKHGFFDFRPLSVSFDTWTTWYNLYTIIWGVYKTELSIVFTMGGSYRLNVNVPGTSGYKNLYVTLKPASRIMTTIIPIYIMEIRDLYISINQGWPCGFGSSYKLLSVTFDTAFVCALVATFKVIHGSGTDIIGIFINRHYFDTYINKMDVKIEIPQGAVEIETRIMDRVSLIYDNEFSDIYQNILQVSFTWPRVKALTGSFSFYVELIPYKGDVTSDLSVMLYAYRQLPKVQPTSKPIIARESSVQEPVWPQVFQVQEIELWGNDPPEVVRRIEIKFAEQVREYYWVSSEQKAYEKNTWEQWAFLTRGYLPKTEYSGQIDYVTMRSLSSMINYSTIDQAIRAMIANFLYSAKNELYIMLNPTGSYSKLLIDMTIRDLSRLRNLVVSIEPMHARALSVDLTII